MELLNRRVKKLLTEMLRLMKGELLDGVQLGAATQLCSERK